MRWVGLRGLRFRPIHAPTDHGSSPLCPCCFCNQDMQNRVDLEPAEKALSHSPSFPSQGQGKTERGDMRSRQNQPCAPWPQGPECEADGTQTLIQDSCCPVLPFWHFILDVSVYSFQNTVVLTSWEPKYTDKNPFWRCSVSFWGRMKMKSAILLMARKKVIKKLRFWYVFVCYIFGQNFQAVYITGLTNSWPYTTMYLFSINSNHYYLISIHSQWIRIDLQNPS